MEAVDPIDLGQDFVADGVDHLVVQSPVHGLGILLEVLVGVRLHRALKNRLVLLDQPGNGLGARDTREVHDRLALHHRPHLPRISDQLHVDGRDLQPALRHGLDQSGSLEAGDQFAHRGQGHLQQFHQFPL